MLNVFPLFWFGLGFASIPMSLLLSSAVLQGGEPPVFLSAPALSICFPWMQLTYKIFKVQVFGDGKGESRFVSAPNVLWKIWQALQEIMPWMPNSHYHINCLCHDSLGMSKWQGTCCAPPQRATPAKGKRVRSSPSWQWKEVPSSEPAPQSSLAQSLVNWSARDSQQSCGKYSCKQNKTGLNSVLSAVHLQRSDCPIDCMSKQQKGKGVDGGSEDKSFKWAFSLPSSEAEWIRRNQSIAWESNLNRLESKSHVKSKQKFKRKFS